jgi:hypothetical protein
MRMTQFPNKVEDLALNLYNIVKDTGKVKASESDSMMLVWRSVFLSSVMFCLQIDLYFRIAQSYRNSPDLRLTWLLNMAKKHESLGSAAEAAQVGVTFLLYPFFSCMIVQCPCCSLDCGVSWS